MIAGVLLAAILSGPVRAEVVRVVDGDTIDVEANPWPRISIRVLVRVRGVDTPEKAQRAACASEAAAAMKASEFTARRLPVGAVLFLSDIDDDKYGGRIIATVTDSGGSLGPALIAAGLAHPYNGGTKSSWCPLGGNTP